MKFLVLLIATMLFGCASSQSILQEKSYIETAAQPTFDFSAGKITLIEGQQYRVVRLYFSASGRECAIVTSVNKQVEQSKACFFKEKLALLSRSLVNEVSQ